MGCTCTSSQHKCTCLRECVVCTYVSRVSKGEMDGMVHVRLSYFLFLIYFLFSLFIFLRKKDVLNRKRIGKFDFFVFGVCLDFG